MDILKDLSTKWFRDLLNNDPLAIAFGVGLLIVGSLLTTAGTRLGARGAFSLAMLGWRGMRWLTTKKQPSELANAIIKTMWREAPSEQGGHTLWYGTALHFHGGDIWVDEHTRANSVLTRAERRQILRRAAEDRDGLARRKVWELRREAPTEEIPYSAL